MPSPARRGEVGRGQTTGRAGEFVWQKRVVCYGSILDLGYAYDAMARTEEDGETLVSKCGELISANWCQRHPDVLPVRRPGLHDQPYGRQREVGGMTLIMRRGVFITLWIVILAVSTACSLKHESLQFNYDNRTSSLLCSYGSPEAASSARCLADIDPLAEKTWGRGCGDGPGAEKARITVIITVKEGGRQIYNRTAECRVWQESDRTFVIEQRGGDFVVTDPFTDAPPSP